MEIPKYLPKYLQRKVRHGLIHLILIMAFFAFVIGLYKGGVHLVELRAESIRIQELPGALALSFLRMVISYAGALFFAYVVGLLAARTTTGERIILPILEIFQSIPIIGFFPAAISFFIGISRGHRLGIELAAIFLIFTSQVWNMTFAVYEAIKTIPQDNLDAIKSFGIKGSQRFWTLYAPASAPRLVYSSILSWSRGWYFLVACEIIAVGPIKYNLPGIGSFLSRAAEQDQIHLIFWGFLALSLFILTLDGLVWRPLTEWSEKFKQDQSIQGNQAYLIKRRSRAHSKTTNQALKFLRSIRFSMHRTLSVAVSPFVWIFKEVILVSLWDIPTGVINRAYNTLYLRFAIPTLEKWHRLIVRARWLNLILMWSVGMGLGIAAGLTLIRWFQPPWPSISRDIPLALLYSTLRVAVTLGLSLIIMLPIVLYSWNKPRLRQALTTIAQIGAGIPAIALFPLFIVLAIKKFHGGMEVVSILLLFSGMQWYILFNGLSGTATIPADLAEATRAFGLSKFQTWKKLVLPAIRPALLTGTLTAWGGGWNALVVSEYITYKNQTLTVNGIGALLNHAVFQLGDNRAIILCLLAMIGWILIINTLVWRPLYRSAVERYKFD